MRKETILCLEKDKHNPSPQLAHDTAEDLKTTMDELFISEDDEK